MSQARCFAPVADLKARTLILGSMPGQASLRKQEYYAHPQNAFWRIQGELIGAWPALAYAERLVILKAHGIALWDVLESCDRPGSLDAAIDETSIVPNDFAAFFATHRNLRKVFFNGAKAEQCFQRYAARGLESFELRYRRLPSTSPAHAGLSFEKKLEAWRAVIWNENLEAIPPMSKPRSGIKPAARMLRKS